MADLIFWSLGPGSNLKTWLPGPPWPKEKVEPQFFVRRSYHFFTVLALWIWRSDLDPFIMQRNYLNIFLCCFFEMDSLHVNSFWHSKGCNFMLLALWFCFSTIASNFPIKPNFVLETIIFGSNFESYIVGFRGVVQLGGLVSGYPWEVPQRLSLLSLFCSLKLKIKNTCLILLSDFV